MDSMLIVERKSQGALLSQEMSAFPLYNTKNLSFTSFYYNYHKNSNLMYVHWKQAALKKKMKEVSEKGSVCFIGMELI